MSKVFDMIFEGDREMLRWLEDMEQPAKQRAIMRPGHKKSDRIIKAAIVSKAPKLTGLLRRSIDIKMYDGKDNAAIISIVGPDTSVKMGRKRYLEMARHKTGRGSRTKFIPDETQKPSRYAPVQEKLTQFTMKAATSITRTVHNTFNRETSKQIIKSFNKSKRG